MVTRQKGFEKWERTRSKGKWNFVLKYGVLFWGLGTAVLFSLFIPMVSRTESFLGILPFALVVFPIGGIVLGVAAWHLSEKAYHKQKPNISSTIDNDSRDKE